MTFAVEEVGQILSRDARGRVLVSRERREALLEECRWRCQHAGCERWIFSSFVSISATRRNFTWSRCLEIRTQDSLRAPERDRNFAVCLRKEAQFAYNASVKNLIHWADVMWSLWCVVCGEVHEEWRVFKAVITRLKRRILRDRLHKFGGLISVLGWTLLVSTFIVKDTLRDRAKDLVNSFELTQQVLFLKTALDRVQDTVISRDDATDVGAATDMRPFVNAPAFPNEPAEKGEIKTLEAYFQRQEYAFGMYLERRRLLCEKLSDDVRKTEKRDQKIAENNLTGLHTRRVLLLTAIEISQMTDAPPERVNKLTDSYKKLVDDYYATYRANSEALNKVSKTFESEARSADRQLRTFSYLSWFVLYPLGILIGILGQLAGVRLPGGE
jgi:hypothetical protein